MTTINLITYDQALIAAHRVKIASGDIEALKLHVEFDDTWNGFPHRSAVFHTSKNDTVYEALMVDDECTVPPEVLTEACVLFIGVRGLGLDGVMLKTSTKAKYRLYEGAPTGDMTLNPSMDLYRQYLNAISEKYNPLMDAKYAQWVADADTRYSQVKIAADTYTGSGEVGEANAITKTFDFAPKLIIITGGGWAHTFFINPATSSSVMFKGTATEGVESLEAFIKWEGNTVSWYNKKSTYEGYSLHSGTFYIFAIG